MTNRHRGGDVMEFLSKSDPILDIKERLYARASALQSIIEMNEKIIPWNEFEGGKITGESSMAQAEINFYNELLDLIERS